MAEKTIMILGAGTMQIPALGTAKKKGWRVIAMDGNPRAPGAGLADIFEPVDLKDRDKLLERAAFYRKNGGLDGVFTAGTDFSVSVAYIAEKLGLPGIPCETACNATNKARMRDLFARRGIPGPRCISCRAEELERLDTFSGTFPVVVKPVDNMGARGVEMVRDPGNLKDTARKALAYSRSGQVIVEEFIEGPEFSIDALIYKGQIYTCGIADRHIFFPPFFVELGHTFPSRAEKRVLSEVEKVFRLGIEALGIDNGAAKGDIFYTSRGAVVGEIAARLSGGYMSGWTCPYACGVDITEGALNIALGLPPGNLEPRRAWTSAERAFISIPGEAAEIRGLDEALDIAGVQDIFTRIETGSAVKFPENNVEKCGNVISAMPEREGAVSAAEKAVSRILVRLVPGNPKTAAFLFGEAGWEPPAFTLPEKPALRIASLPPWQAREGAGENFPVFSPGGIIIAAPEYANAEIRADWNHRQFAESLESIAQLLKDQPPPAWASRLILGRVFWRAFIRGGIQGGLWVLDTLRREKTAENVEARIREWKP